MKLLVTGGAGFIGSNFIRWLVNSDSNVTLTHVDALTYAGNLASLKDLLDHPRHRFIKGDIRDRSLFDDLIPQHDLLINFAAESHVDRSIDGPQSFIDTNIQGTFNLLECSRRYMQSSPSRKLRFVQVSTDEVYGSLGEDGKFSEDSVLAPNSPYSSSKAAADLLVRAYHHTYGMDTITTRCSNNYGAFQFPEKLIPLMIMNAKGDKPLPVYGDGKNVRDWIHVLDHGRGVWLAATLGKAGEVYNFGADNEWRNIDIVKFLLRELGKPESLISYVKDRPGHDRRYAVDASKARRDLGWSPQISFDEGLRGTIAWYQANDEWLRSVTSGAYRDFHERWYKERK